VGNFVKVLAVARFDTETSTNEAIRRAKRRERTVRQMEESGLRCDETTLEDSAAKRCPTYGARCIRSRTCAWRHGHPKLPRACYSNQCPASWAIRVDSSELCPQRNQSRTYSTSHVPNTSKSIIVPSLEVLFKALGRSLIFSTGP
jgi:hypothetical protein